MYKRGVGAYKIPAVWGLEIYTPTPHPPLKNACWPEMQGGGAYIISPWIKAKTHFKFSDSDKQRSCNRGKMIAGLRSGTAHLTASSFLGAPDVGHTKLRKMSIRPTCQPQTTANIRIILNPVARLAESLTMCFQVENSDQFSENSDLRGPAAILFISRDTCSDSIAKLFRACFCGVSHNYRAIRCKMGYRTDVSVLN